MTCPNCGAIFDTDCRFCGTCGTPLTIDKKGTHRVPILILLFLSVLGICVFFATGGSGTGTPAVSHSETPWFSVRNGNLLFDKSAYFGPGELTVPETVNGETVVWIEDGCFRDCDALTVVKLPDTVEHIGLNAFADCDRLRALDLPPAVATIGTDAFADCKSLEAIHIPASVNYIGWDAFEGCDNLRFIFFDGTINEWSAVYGQLLSPKTEVCCADGNYFQSE